MPFQLNIFFNKNYSKEKIFFVKFIKKKSRLNAYIYDKNNFKWNIITNSKKQSYIKYINLNMNKFYFKNNILFKSNLFLN